MNWDALGRETVELGREYLTLDTTNPPGNETVGARFLERVLGRDGIASEIAESAPGRGNLVARLPGDGSEGGIVLHHQLGTRSANSTVTSLRSSEARVDVMTPPGCTRNQSDAPSSRSRLDLSSWASVARQVEGPG